MLKINVPFTTKQGLTIPSGLCVGLNTLVAHASTKVSAQPIYYVNQGSYADQEKVVTPEELRGLAVILDLTTDFTEEELSIFAAAKAMLQNKYKEKFEAEASIGIGNVEVI